MAYLIVKSFSHSQEICPAVWQANSLCSAVYLAGLWVSANRCELTRWGGWPRKKNNTHTKKKKNIAGCMPKTHGQTSSKGQGRRLRTQTHPFSSFGVGRPREPPFSIPAWLGGSENCFRISSTPCVFQNFTSVDRFYDQGQNSRRLSGRNMGSAKTVEEGKFEGFSESKGSYGDNATVPAPQILAGKQGRGTRPGHCL